MTRNLNLPQFSSIANTDGTPTRLLPALTQTAESRQMLFAVSGKTESVLAAHDIRWLDGEEVRLPVLLLRWAPTESGKGDVDWCPVVPLWTDVESAIPGDLILDTPETTTGMIWRTAFNHQTEVPSVFLGDLIGRLTSPGVELVTLACDGVVPADRTGSEFESTNDPRLEADAWIGQVITEVMERASEYWTEEAVDSGDTHASRPDATVSAIGQVIHLRPQFVQRRKAFALAAATQTFEEECVLVPDNTALIDAVATLDIGTNELRMEVRNLAPRFADVPAEVVVTFRDESQVKVRVVLGTKTFVLNSELPVSEYDIKSVEMRLS